jgi:hypothetical protein
VTRVADLMLRVDLLALAFVAATFALLLKRELLLLKRELQRAWRASARIDLPQK